MTALPRTLLGAAAAFAGWAAPGEAATCNVSPQGVSFGSYDALDPSPLDGVGNIAITCDSATSFTLSLSTGAGSYAQRRMNGVDGALVYNIFTDASRLIVWGDGGGGSNTVSMTAIAADVPVYGRLPARQNLPAGAYVDTIVVTVTY